MTFFINKFKFDINTNVLCQDKSIPTSMFSVIWDDGGLVSESRWISRTLPLSEISLSSSLQKSSSLSLSWWTDSLKSSKETRELKRSSFMSVDSGGAERDWKLYRKHKSISWAPHFTQKPAPTSDLCSFCWLDWSLVTPLNPALSQLHSSHIHYITLEPQILVFATLALC